MELRESGPLAVELVTSTVRGVVQLTDRANQLPEPSDPRTYSRGALLFVDLRTKSWVAASLPASGPASFEATLWAGDYQVLWVPRAPVEIDGRRLAADPDLYPWIATIVERHLEVGPGLQEGLQLTLPRPLRYGTTLASSASFDGWSLEIRSQEPFATRSVTTSIAQGGTAARVGWSGLLWPGWYEVAVDVDSEGGLDTGKVILERALDLRASAQLHYELPSAHLGVTLGGKAEGDEVIDLVLEPHDQQGRTIRLRLEPGARASTAMLEGTYRVTLVRSSNTEDHHEVRVPVAEALYLRGTSELSLELPDLAPIVATVHLPPEAPPALTEFERLALVDRRSGARYEVWRERGQAVVPREGGVFDVELVSGSEAFGQRLWRLVVATDVTLLPGQALEVDVELFEVQGQLTIYGEPFRPQDRSPYVKLHTGPAAHLLVTQQPIDPTGRFRLLAPAGTYLLSVSISQGIGSSHKVGMASGEVIAEIAIDADTPTPDLGELALPYHPVSLELLLDGAQLPDNTLGDRNRGELILSRRNGSPFGPAGSSVFSLGSSGPGRVDAWLLQGHYRLFLDGERPDLQNVLLSGQTMPIGALEVDGPITTQRDISILEFTPRLTVDGQAPQFSGARPGHLQFSYHDEFLRSFSLDATGEGAAMRLYSGGGYQLVFVPDPGASTPGSQVVFCR